MEMHLEGRHDPYQWQGLSLCEVYWVSLHAKMQRLCVDYRDREFEW